MSTNLGAKFAESGIFFAFLSPFGMIFVRTKGDAERDGRREDSNKSPCALLRFVL